MKVILLNAVEYRLRFPLDVRKCFKTSSFQFNFQLGKQTEITRGYVQRQGGWGMIAHLCLRQSSAHFLSSVSKGNKSELTVVLRGTLSFTSKRNNEHALCWTLDMQSLFLLLVIVGSSSSTTVALFQDHNSTSSFFARYHRRNKNWVLVRLHSLHSHVYALLVWSFVMSRGTNFAAIQSVFKFSKISRRTP
jgi:hypothetical protein